MDASNPYEPPSHLSPAESVRARRRVHDRAGRYLSVWLAVFVANLAIPLQLGWPMTRESGRIGLVVATPILAASSGWVCMIRKDFGAPLIAGAILVGTSQFFPILHVLAGVFALSVGQASGLVDGGDGESERIVSELGGFVVTLVTGGLLLVASAIAGSFVWLICPKRWRPDVGEPRIGDLSP